ncbi:MAG: GNAT family N-acetyltransferase [Eubacterium sp.]|nr:GNAT family N-acetyltransferase [Eubacterium sp.]
MTTEIRKALKQDIPALCDIWKACFSDSDEYVKLFYDENFERIEVLALFVNEKPVSMINLLDASFADEKAHRKSKLIYATGTLPEHRKKGYMGALIEHVTDKAKKEDFALFLKPSSPSLIKYYKKYGFELDSYFRLITVTPNKKQDISASDLSYKEYNRMRDAHFSKAPYVKWQDEHLRWCAAENEYFNGKTLKLRQNGNEHFLMCYPEGRHLIISETDMSLTQIKELSGALCDMFSTEAIKAYVPDTFSEGERIVSSLVYNAELKNYYVNLILI